MLRRFALAKIHRATVTSVDLNYEGSIGVDSELMERCGMLPGEMVSIFNINNGLRFDTYLQKLPAGSREICLNGAAARLGAPGDRIIILTYGYLNEEEAARHHLRVLVLDEENRLIEER
jgi:aspartate 1-decarboxylase